MPKTDRGPALAAPIDSHDSPTDYAKLGDYFDEELAPPKLFENFKQFQHHLTVVQSNLEATGALTRIGKLLYVHRRRFWPEFIVAHREAAHRRASSLLLGSKPDGGMATSSPTLAQASTDQAQDTVAIRKRRMRAPAAAV